MQQKISKSLLVIAATLAGTVLLGIIGVSRRYGAILPTGVTFGNGTGVAFIIVGLALSLVVSVLILRYFIFFTRIEVLDSVGNALTDNSTISIGGTMVRPIVVTSVLAVLSMIFIGFGFGIVFDQLVVYVLYLGAIALLSLTVSAVIFLFSVVRHKIRRRFAWVASALFALLALLFLVKAIPSIKDISVNEDELTAVTGIVSGTSPSTGILAGPGRTQVVIKGTSGESLALRFSGGSGELRKGSRYTFYYLPNTKLVDKVVEAEPVKY